VVVRTLDAGADKPLAFLDLGDEPNPALGVRACAPSAAGPNCSPPSSDFASLGTNDLAHTRSRPTAWPAWA
jgi:phosphoenolpyruvate-protein kinase (PTS system EI component)